MPRAWHDIDEPQLRYWCTVAALYGEARAKVMFCLRLMGLRPLVKLEDGSWECLFRGEFTTRATAEEIAWWSRPLDFLDTPNYAVRCHEMRGHKAHSRLWQEDVSMGEYLRLENLWFAYLTTEEAQYVDQIAPLLYEDWGEVVELSPGERYEIVLWVAGVKRQLQSFFPHFFGQPTADGSLSGHDMLQLTDAQIRALTGGDITKEEAVLACPVWRALSELDAKSREAEELHKISSR